MREPPPNAELLRSLGRLVRGLSALFWGLPIALIICVETAKTDWLQAFAILPPMASTALLLFGLWQLGSFQKQERPWRHALDRARLFALINFMLSPFLFWWNRMPEQPMFAISVALLALSAVLFLFSINYVLQQLGDMLPDEALRHETRQYTALNRNLLLVLLLLAALYIGLLQIRDLPLQLKFVLLWLDRSALWAIIFLVLLPLAMTLALIWKTKEVILESVFGAHH
ncbi:MAG TPA: hypothetical protein VFD66_03340 [Verrucomicrobiae bacterium]|nr:hypothetical protein [Verrucomicrobiae bacterium]